MLLEKYANYTGVYKVKVLLISSRLTIPTAQGKPAWAEMICTPDFSYSSLGFDQNWTPIILFYKLSLALTIPHAQPSKSVHTNLLHSF